MPLTVWTALLSVAFKVLNSLVSLKGMLSGMVKNSLLTGNEQYTSKNVLHIKVYYVLTVKEYN
jgi:hypothetical protein